MRIFGLHFLDVAIVLIYLVGMMLIGVIMVLYIFLMVLPQRREQRKAKEMLDAIKKNDRVIFGGGILGTVVNVHQDGYVTLRIDDASNAKLRVLRGAISRVLTEEDKLRHLRDRF